MKSNSNNSAPKKRITNNYEVKKHYDLNRAQSDNSKVLSVNLLICLQKTGSVFPILCFYFRCIIFRIEYNPAFSAILCPVYF